MLRYSKQVEQSCEDNVCLAHMDLYDDHAESQTAWAPCPCTSELFDWVLYESQIIYMSKPSVVISEQKSPADDARVQRLPQYLDKIYSMLEYWWNS